MGYGSVLKRERERERRVGERRRRSDRGSMYTRASSPAARVSILYTYLQVRSATYNPGNRGSASLRVGR